jgi:hypothetical protein
MSSFGFLRKHPGLTSRMDGAAHWAKLKAVCDIESEQDRRYWRIHDGLYDLSAFDHPGGKVIMFLVC